MKCKPCRVTYKSHRYQIDSDGSVRNITAYIQVENDRQNDLGIPRLQDRGLAAMKASDVTALVPQERFDIAREVRQEAARQRRNRNQRERSQAMRSLGMKHTPYGWE